MKRVFSDPITLANGNKNIVIASTAVVYTKAFKMSYGEYFSLDYKAVSDTGDPSIKIELEQSIGDNLPTTEGSSDTNYVEPENMSDIEADLTTETWKKKSLSPVPSMYARLKITGSGTNEADTIVSAYINRQEEF